MIRGVFVKKGAKIIIIAISALLVAAAVLLGIFLSGSSLFADALGNGSAAQVKVLETQYKITKKPSVLANLCDALAYSGNMDDSKEHYEKTAYYFELYLENGKDFSASDFAVYLTALSRLSATDKLKTEIENYMKSNHSGDDYKTLYVALFAVKQNGSEEEKEYIKEIAKEITDGSYLKSDSKTEYEELVNKYTILAE